MASHSRAWLVLSAALLLAGLSPAASQSCTTTPGQERAACFCQTVTVYKYYADTANGCTGQCCTSNWEGGSWQAGSSCSCMPAEGPPVSTSSCCSLAGQALPSIHTLSNVWGSIQNPPKLTASPARLGRKHACLEHSSDPFPPTPCPPPNLCPRPHHTHTPAPHPHTCRRHLLLRARSERLHDMRIRPALQRGPSSLRLAPKRPVHSRTSRNTTLPLPLTAPSTRQHTPTTTTTTTTSPSCQPLSRSHPHVQILRRPRGEVRRQQKDLLPERPVLLQRR